MSINRNKLKLSIITSAIMIFSFNCYATEPIYLPYPINEIKDIDDVDLDFFKFSGQVLKSEPDNFYRHGQLITSINSLRKDIPIILTSEHATVVIVSSIHKGKTKTTISYNNGYNFEDLTIDGFDKLRFSSLSNNGQYAILIANDLKKGNNNQLFIYDTYLKKYIQLQNIMILIFQNQPIY